MPNDRANLLANLGLPVPDRDRSGTREGWLNLGGYVQYTLIADVPRQFTVSAGLRWEAPMGATQLFQGAPIPLTSLPTSRSARSSAATISSPPPATNSRPAAVRPPPTPII